MRHIIYCLVFLHIMSCTTDNKQSEQSKSIKAVKQDSTTKNESVDEDVLSDEDDCIFDLATQDSSFLIGISEFENFTWDSKTKDAHILLANNDSLIIHIGGCHHYSVSARLVLNSMDSSLSKSQVLDFVNTITVKLPEEFYHTSLITSLEEKKYDLSINEHGWEILFEDEYLSSKNYYINYKYLNNKNKVEVGYYIN